MFTDKVVVKKYTGIYILFFLIVCFLAAYSQNKILAAIAWGMLGLLGVGVVVSSVGALSRARQSLSWPRCNGIVISAESVLRRYSEQERRYYLSVEYKFHVDGVDYKGGNYNWLGFWDARKENVDAVVDSLLKAPHVTVYYNPRFPDKSVLNPSVSPLCFVGFLVGAGIIVASIFQVFALFFGGCFVLCIV